MFIITVKQNKNEKKVDENGPFSSSKLVILFFMGMCKNVGIHIIKFLITGGLL